MISRKKGQETSFQIPHYDEMIPLRVDLCIAIYSDFTWNVWKNVFGKNPQQMALKYIFSRQRRTSNPQSAASSAKVQIKFQKLQFCNKYCKYCKICFAKMNHKYSADKKNVERFTILRVILAQGPC